MKTHTFRTWKGKRRRYTVHIDAGLDGLTEVPDAPGDHVTYQICVNINQTPFQLFETALHESMHAVDPDATEEYVGRVSAEQARFVWRCLREWKMLR